MTTTTDPATNERILPELRRMNADIVQTMRVFEDVLATLDRRLTQLEEARR